MTGLQAAWVCGLLYYRLNADELGTSGTVVGIGTAGAVVRPDGWPLPRGAWPDGMIVPVESLAVYDGPARCGPVVDGRGAVVSAETVEQVIAEYLGIKQPW